MQDFLKTVLKLKTQKEAQDFFRDVATLAELQALAERWEVARLLDKGWSYRKISEKTGVSTTPVTRIAYWMDNGRGGYERMLKKVRPGKKKPAAKKIAGSLKKRTTK